MFESLQIMFGQLPKEVQLTILFLVAILVMRIFKRYGKTYKRNEKYKNLAKKNHELTQRLIEAQKQYAEQVDANTHGTKNAVELANATAELVAACCGVSKLDEAITFLERMKTYGSDEGCLVARAKAMQSLIETYEFMDEVELAEEIYAEMKKLGTSTPVREVICQTTFVLICFYRDAGYMDKAEQLYEGMNEFGLEEPFDNIRADANVNLAAGYLWARNYTKAESLYEQMTELGHSSAVMLARAYAAEHLIRAYCAVKKKDAAQKIYESMHALPATEEITAIKNKMLIVLHGDAKK